MLNRAILGDKFGYIFSKVCSAIRTEPKGCRQSDNTESLFDRVVGRFGYRRRELQNRDEKAATTRKIVLPSYMRFVAKPTKTKESLHLKK